jgi:anti-sigma regulatory factor (Ser/Thr protein kinase)
MSPGELCDRLLASLLEDGRAADDIALLAVQAAGHFGPRLQLTLPAEVSALASMRRSMRPWLEDLGATDDEAYDILVAVGEAAANSVEHAYGPVEAGFDISAEVADHEVLVIVRDSGKWREPRGRNRGRGTFLMRELMDTIDVITSETGTEVRLTRRLGRVPA